MMKKKCSRKTAQMTAKVFRRLSSSEKEILVMAFGLNQVDIRNDKKRLRPGGKSNG
jgi:hypothetical protein